MQATHPAMSATMWLEAVAKEFKRAFGAQATVVARAPGRVNLIGEHTDYNEGFVLPFAIDRTVWVAAGTGTKAQVSVRSAAIGETVDFGTDVCQPSRDAPWQNLVRGVVHGLRGLGIPVEGANLFIAGDLPMSCGLSSSAALSVATAMALARLSNAELRPADVIKLAQRSEHDFVGTPCGIMDPYVSLFGRAGQAVLLNCRMRAHEYVPLELPGCAFVVIHSGVARDLSRGDYQRRVEECRSAASKLAVVNPFIRTLRDATTEIVQQAADRLNPVEQRRARHVVTENQRVHAAVDVLQRRNPAEFGRLLLASHDSLRDDFEVSCEPIEELMGLLRKRAEVLGARMIGGGFGGCILALVVEKAVPTVCACVAQEYDRGHPTPSRAFTVRASSGAECRS